MSEYKTKGQKDCADCEWIADETDGEVLICGECQQEQHINYLKFQAREENRKEFQDEVGILYINGPDAQ